MEQICPIIIPINEIINSFSFFDWSVDGIIEISKKELL